MTIRSPFPPSTDLSQIRRQTEAPRVTAQIPPPTSVNVFDEDGNLIGVRLYRYVPRPAGGYNECLIQFSPPPASTVPPIMIGFATQVQVQLVRARDVVSAGVIASTDVLASWYTFDSPDLYGSWVPLPEEANGLIINDVTGLNGVPIEAGTVHFRRMPEAQ